MLVELFIDDLEYLCPQGVNVFDGEVGGVDRFVDDHAGVTLVEELRSGRPDVPCSVDRHRYHRETGRDSHPEGAFLERMQRTVAAPGPFGEHDERIPVDLCPSHALIDSGVGRSSGTPVDLDHAGHMKGLGEDRDLVELFLGEVPDRGGDRSKQQRDIEVRQVIGEEEILCTRLDMLGAGYFVAHRRDQQEHSAPQLDDELTYPAQPQGHRQDESRRDEDRIQHE